MSDRVRNSPRPLFPMALTSVEKLHFYDDTPEFPNNVFCRLCLSGTVDRDKAVQAIKFFESRHPMINVVVRQRGTQLVWDGHVPPSETIRWSDTWERPRFEGLDLRNAPNRIVFLCAEKRTEIWLQFHHATFDGGAGIRIINEWFVAYANLVAERPVGTGIPRLDDNLIRTRGSLKLLSWSYAKHLYKQPIAVFGAYKFLFRRFDLLTSGIAQRSSPTSLHETFPLILGRWLDAKAVTSLRTQAKAHGVSLNTVMIAHLYLALWAWKRAHQSGRSNGWIRVVMPMTIRTMMDRRLSAANRSSIVHIDRRPQDGENTESLLKGLQREIDIIQAWHLDKTFLIAVRAMSVFPGWLESFSGNKKYRGTIVFTNLGHPFDRNRRLRTPTGIASGSLKLEAFDLVGPIRRGIGVNISVQNHEDRTRLSMHVDPRQIDVALAEDLLNTYVDQLTQHPF